MKKILGLIFLYLLSSTHALAVSAPTFQASGTAVSSNNSAITPTWPTHIIGDIALLIVETAPNQTVTFSSNNSGFVQVSNSPQIAGSGTNGTKLTVFWARATSTSMENPIIVDTGDHQIAQIITFRNVVLTGNPWDVIVGDTNSSSGTNFSIPSGITTVANSLVINIVSNGTDSSTVQTSGWTNTNLSSLQEITDVNTNTGNGGGFGVAAGVKVTAGNYGTTTGVLATSSVQARLSIALKPLDTGPILHYSFDDCTIGNSITTISDSSGNNNVATGYNGLKCVATDTGKGAQFDGIDDYAKSNSNYSFTYDVGYTVYSRLLVDSWTARRAWVLYFGVPDATPTCNNNGMHWLINVGPNVTCGETLPLGTTQFGVFCGAQDQFVLTNSKLQTYISFATVYDASTKKLTTYMDGIKVGESTASGNPTSGNAPVYLGRPGPSWMCESYFKGIMDDVKIYPRTLSDDEIKQLFTGNGAFSATEDSQKTDFVYGKINTKIVSSPFDLRILARDANDFTVYKDANISKIEVITCNDASCTDWATTTRVIDTKNYTAPNYLNIAMAQGYSALVNFSFAKAYQNLRLRITGTVDNAQSFQTSLSKDAFAIRPKNFTISASSAPYYAGENFVLTFDAKDNLGNDTTDYNETKSNSFEVNASVPMCTLKDLNVTSFSFTNGFKDLVSTSYSDVGDITISIGEKLGYEFAKIDASDTSDANRLITPATLVVTVNPYELNITDANFTASTGQSWLYDANVSDMYVSAHATVQANNKQHVALQNFTSSCYAQPVDLSFYYDANNTNSNTNFSYSIINGVMTSALKTFSDINKTITIPAASFSTASASADYRFNIDRAYNVPLSPIDVALRDVKVTSTAVAKDENNATVNKAARFYYGRIKTKDIVTDKTIAPHLLHVEVYSPTAISGFYQNSLNWYINADDDGTTVLSDGNFSENKAFVNNQPSSSVNISGTTSFIDGIVKFNINNLLEEKGSVVHVSIPTWLWNSTLSDYNNSVGATCVSHPCFDYKYIKDKDTTGIKSGTFKGSTIGNDYNASYQKSGVKTFR